MTHKMGRKMAEVMAWVLLIGLLSVGAYYAFDFMAYWLLGV